METMTVDHTIDTTFRVLERLAEVQTGRGGWMARCPCCHTANALKVGIDPSMAIVAFVGLDCAAGCERSRLYAWAGLPTPQRWLM